MSRAMGVEDQARRAGLQLVVKGDRTEVHKGERVMSFHTDASRALKKALERMEEERLRDVDKLPSDREPVLIVTPKKRVRGAARALIVPTPADIPPPVLAAPVPPPEADAVPSIDEIELLVASTPPAPMPVPALVPEHAIEQKPISRSIIKSKYKDRYKKNGFSCGDDIANELGEYCKVIRNSRLVVDVAKLKAVAVKNEVWRDSYSNLNVGQQRMTIGNRLRVRFQAGDVVDIGGAIYQMSFD